MSVDIAAAGDPDAALTVALRRIAAGAGARDAARSGAFPADAFAELRAAGALAGGARSGTRRPPAAGELALVRRVAGADGSVGRILDGHRNAVERLAVHGEPGVRDPELALVGAGRLLAGVWGGTPAAGEGPPATLRSAGRGEVVRGVLTFCSGAGGLDRAAALVRDPDGAAPCLVWLDLADPGVEIDRTWFRGAGLTAAASHRVVFHDVPVRARLGPPGAISAQPWFARDALRTAASWAGLADSAHRAAVATLAGRPDPGELDGLAVARMATAVGTIDAWLAAAARAMDAALLTPAGGPAGAELAALALHGRDAIAGACRALLAEAERACGSHPFARGDALDRARRDLGLFLLQHRLEPPLARAGLATLRGLT